MTTRRDFLKHSALGAAGLTIGGLGFSTESFANIMGANEKIRVGIVGFSDRARHSLIPAFMACADELGFEIVAISDIWKRRREEGVAFFQEKYGKKVKAFRNNEELYDAKMCDAVIVATSDFQHALHCIEAVKAGCDAYVEKPFADGRCSCCPQSCVGKWKDRADWFPTPLGPKLSCCQRLYPFW